MHWPKKKKKLVNPNNDIGECVSLFIPHDKKKTFWDIIKEAGYSEDSKGILEFILDEPGEDEDQNFDGDEPTGSFAMNAINKWQHENPEEWKTIKEKGSSAMKNLLNKIKGKF